MAEKALSQIVEAEAQAQAVLINAQEAAAQMVENAEKETETAFLQCCESFQCQEAEKKRQAKADAQTKSLEFSKQTDELCVALRERLLEKKSNGVDAVIKLIS